MELRDSKDNWETLKNAYESKSKTKTEFLQIKYQLPESMTVYLVRLKQARKRLENSGKKNIPR